VKSAELYLHLSRLHKGNNNEEVRWKASAGKALQRAEKIKTFVEKSSGVPARDPLGTTSDIRLTPIGVDHFSRRASSDGFSKELTVRKIQMSSFMS
jgi:calpain-7